MPNPSRRAISPYPFQGLEQLQRSSVRAARQVRRRLGQVPNLQALGRELSALLEEEIEILPRGLVGEHSVREKYGYRAAFEIATAGIVAVLNLEPALVAEIAGRLLRQPRRLIEPGVVPDPALYGAIAAVVIEATRRAYPTGAMRLAAAPAEDSSRAVVYFTVLCGGRPYEGSATLAISNAGDVDQDAPSLRALGALPVVMPLVIGTCIAARSELRALAVGDALMPAQGLWLKPDGSGRAAFAAPAADWGISVQVGQRGEVVLGHQRVELLFETDFMPSDEKPSELSAAVLEAPVVVRIEMGTVTLTAHEWAALGPGDVIEAGRRVAQPVILRVSGREVAEGELVSIEGELGVRIRRLFTGDVATSDAKPGAREG